MDGWDGWMGWMDDGWINKWMRQWMNWMDEWLTNECR